ncbi:MAG: radical SAM protein [Bryobacterales bacterium]|jgi:MoaA/NifB/PqqE/SkfB family radical SAM enzyme|nr:radical SAM protein [Bryobacterales bacterium]
MKITEVLSAWKGMLAGRLPSLSIEVTRECPLRCPGCYAYDDGHLGGGVTLRELRDFKGEALVNGVLEVVDRLRPLHLSIVGGDPLVRYREMEALVPQLLSRGIHVQVVTSAFREIPKDWIGRDHLGVVVSIDGLQPEHDVRRAPATYDRILKSIAGHSIIIHSTVTGQMMRSPGHLDKFLAFWTARPEVRKVWFSLFTPQIGDSMEEILTPEERSRAVDEFLVLREKYAKLDMPPRLIREFRRPPQSPADCVFSQSTHTISADLRTKVTPCQFGGNPDCTQCGCVASMGLAAIGSYKVFGLVRADSIMKASIKIGQMWRPEEEPEPAPSPLRVLQ